jgi:site-specific recombinase XerD
VRVETAKNRQPRVVMMPHRLRQILQEYWQAREKQGIETIWFWISTTHKNHRFTKDGLKHLVDRLSARAGFRVKLHKFRHTFATQFYAGSHDIAGLQQILGHKDLNTTMIYAHTIPKHTAASMEKNPLNQVV